MTFLNELVDPRKRANSCDHNFVDILVIAICAIICGADTWEEMEEYGEEKEDWLRTFLELPHGIPSHDTFYRVFCMLDPDKFQESFTRWVRSAYPEALDIPDGDAEVIPIDGKAIKGSRGKGKGRKAVLMVSAWSTKLSLVLGQKKVDSKSNEITAIPQLLEAIDLKGCMITADAISCQKSIAETCISQEADYLLAVKGNQKTLHNDIQTAVEDHWNKHSKEPVSGTFFEHENKGHGRHEYRCCWVFDDLSAISTADEWTGIKQFSVVQSDRTIDNKATTALRFYISSKAMTAEETLNATRQHWEVENNLHWMLDVAFNEDACQTKDEYAAENLSTLRRIALNVLKADVTSKKSINTKRKKAGWSNKYLAQLLKSFIVGG